MNSNNFMQVQVQKKYFFEFKFEFGKMIEFEFKFEFAALLQASSAGPVNHRLAIEHASYNSYERKDLRKVYL